MKRGRVYLLGMFFVVLGSSNVLATDSGIMNYCKKLMGDSYSMIESCIKSEEKSKDELQSRSTSPEIMSYCKTLMGDSYSMVESCIKSEEESKKRLGL